MTTPPSEPEKIGLLPGSSRRPAAQIVVLAMLAVIVVADKLWLGAAIFSSRAWRIGLWGLTAGGALIGICAYWRRRP